MKEVRKQELLRKGWSQREITTAEAIVDRKLPHDVFFSQIVFWSALLVIVIGNIIVSFVAIPFLMFLNQWQLYVMIIILAGMIGFLYNFLINDIGHLERKHHVTASILIPVLAVVNLLIVVFVANTLIMDLGIKNDVHNPWALSIVFAVAFILPFIADQIRLAFKRN
ncbi:MAG: hypothetical protein Q8R37_03280 [Nanoarchaeota archaeon]|nr:hypothetical protein [Nanoarchaeota archaeon]